MEIEPNVIRVPNKAKTSRNEHATLINDQWTLAIQMWRVAGVGEKKS